MLSNCIITQESLDIYNVNPLQTRIDDQIWSKVDSIIKSFGEYGIITLEVFPSPNENPLLQG